MSNFFKFCMRFRFIMRLFTFLFNIFLTNITIVSRLLQRSTFQMNNKTNLLKEYVNFVDNTKKQNKYFKIIIFVLVIIMFLALFKYLIN